MRFNIIYGLALAGLSAGAVNAQGLKPQPGWEASGLKPKPGYEIERIETPKRA